MRTTCRSCGSEKLSDISSFGEQYLSDFVDTNKRPDKYMLDLIMCQNCTLVQLRHTTPPEKMYNDSYGYKSGINNTIKADLKEIVESALARTQVRVGDIVLDIGANDGTLLSNYPEGLHRVAFEPVRKLAKECSTHAYVINDFFNYEKFQEYYPGKTAKIITFISCFYDLEDPNKVVADLVKILDPQGTIVIQQNYLAGMIKQNAFDNIVHEHLEYYSLKSMEHLLNKHGLEVFEVETNSINGGSFRTYIRHMNSVDKMRLFEHKMRLDNKWTYTLFAMRVKKEALKLNKFITEEVAKGKTVYLYGASTRGNSLIQFATLNNKLIKAAVERNPEKWGKRIASLDIPIISEEQARKEKPDYMLVCPWFFKEEFLKREEEYLKSGGKFIFPLPQFDVVGYEDISHNS